MLSLCNQFPKVQGKFDDELRTSLENQLQVDCLRKDQI